MFSNQEAGGAGDGQVDETGVEPASAAVMEIMAFPGTGEWMERPGDAGSALFAVREGMEAEQLVVVRVGDM